MRDIKIVTPIVAKTNDELTENELRLVTKAREASRRAYAPYSHFHVGAAIKLDNGEIVVGNNQENAAFPSSLCAERTTCYWAHANFPDATFECIAIAALDTTGMEVKQPIPPCGACRQALLEYEKLAGHDVPVILAGRDEVYILPSVKSLMPLSFTDFE